MRVTFGQFVADTQAERLWKDGVERLREQPLQVRFALLRNPGEVVSRETLRQNLWDNSTYVDFDNGLNTAISRLREMLEDNSTNPMWIETVPKRGYRFHRLAAASRLTSKDTTSFLRTVRTPCRSR